MPRQTETVEFQIASLQGAELSHFNAVMRGLRGTKLSDGERKEIAMSKVLLARANKVRLAKLEARQGKLF